MILIVDDDPSVTASLALLLKQAGYASYAVTGPADALAWLEANPCDLVLQDMNFSRRTTGQEGMELLTRIRATQPALPVVLITAWGSIDLAVRGLKAGASDFVVKPWANEQILQTVRTALGLSAAPPSPAGQAPSREELDAAHDFGHLVGEDPRLRKVLQVIGRVAPTDASVLIMGESGTGKELIADAIHRNSRRRSGPFVKVNLGGISSSLFESEMFGHVRGAFTDARQDREGRFALADGGTIFLDEIGDLDPASQVKLLRVLQDRTFEVLGSSQRRTADVRVVSATNRNLAEMVVRGEFREDLLYRVNLITLTLPPLRDRRDDIPILAGRFLQAVGQVYRRDGLRLSDDAVRWLRQQPWPGNVRQLRQSLERTVLIADDPVLTASDFRRTADMEPVDPGREVLPPVGSMTMDEIEKAMIVKSLKHHGGNVSKVAEALGLSRAALYRRFEKYEIPRVTLRARFVLYLVTVHGLLAWAAVWLIRTNVWWLFAAEAVFVVSFATGLYLIHRFFTSLDFIRDSAQLLEDSDLMSRYREVGQPGIDRLVRVYNRMVDSLREERVRLQEQQQFLSRVLRESPGGILVLDFEGRIEMANPAALRLLQAESVAVIGRGLLDLDRPLTASLAALPEGQSRVLALWGGRRVRVAHGTFLDRGFRRGFFLLEELTEELRQSEKAAYEKLVRMLSHEVNNTVGASNSLLNSCLSYASQLGAEDRADFEHAIGVVIGRTAELNTFMRGFADVVRLPPPRRQMVAPDALVDDLVRLVGPECTRRHITLRREVDPDVIPVPMDRSQIEQALLNVAKNGIEAIGTDGTLTVRVGRRDGTQVFELEDTGPGIPADVREQLFTPFFSTKEGGQGIGLTLVQEILSNHQFGYALEAPPGGPTRFTIVFGR